MAPLYLLTKYRLTDNNRMKNKLIKINNNKNRKGYITTEYAVVTGGIIVAMFVPIPGVGESVVDLVLSALTNFQAHSNALLAMP